MNISIQRSRGSHLLFVLPALLLALLVHFRGASTFFAQDDITFLSRAAGLEPRVGFFRPVSADLWFRVQFACFGLDPTGYHVLSLVLHLLNVVGVYALALGLRLSRATAGAAAVLFGVASLAFTPLHWSTGAMELLACLFLVGATCLQIAVRDRGWKAHSAAAGIALLAMLSKETAVGWIILVALSPQLLPPGPARYRSLLPALAVTACFLGLLVGLGPRVAGAPGDAYALDLSSTHLVRNLLTYVRWNVTPGEPVRDVVASADPDAWRTGLPVLLGLAGILWWFGRPAASVFRFGSVWWLAFLLPVLPLANHTYLYYLYIPWAGGAIAAAALGEALFRRLPRAWAPGLAVLALATYAAVEARSIAARERATRDHLHIDRTLRDSALLRHALPRLRSAGLPSGTPVAFVNPVPRSRFDLMTGAPTRPELMASRRPYYPLEAAMRRGETLRLFVPGLIYRGFADTIPSGWEDAQIFYFEQRGWLQPWGRGQQALLRQAELQAKLHRWESARITYARVRAICDTIPEAVYGHYMALRELGREGEARVLGTAFLSRWPNHRLSVSVRPAPPRGVR